MRSWRVRRPRLPLAAPARRDHVGSGPGRASPPRLLASQVLDAMLEPEGALGTIVEQLDRGGSAAAREHAVVLLRKIAEHTDALNRAIGRNPARIVLRESRQIPCLTQS